MINPYAVYILQAKAWGFDGRSLKVATLAEIEAQGWSLNLVRYVGVAEQTSDDFDFAERFGELNEKLEILNAEAHQLEERIAENVVKILEDKV